MTFIDLIPIQVQDIRTVIAMDLNVVQHTLFSEVHVEVTLKHQNSPDVVKIIRIQGEEYSNWGYDDTYLINLVANKLGVTLP